MACDTMESKLNSVALPAKLRVICRAQDPQGEEKKKSEDLGIVPSVTKCFRNHSGVVSAGASTRPSRYDVNLICGLLVSKTRASVPWDAVTG